MSYVRFVPGFSRHPKRLKCGPISSWLWACSVDYCMEHLTDGFLLEMAVPTLCPNIVGSALKRAVDNLLAVGSWERVQGGYLVHDYLRHNASKAVVEADLENGRNRYYRWLAKKNAKLNPNGVANALANGTPNSLAAPLLTPLLTQPSVCLSDITSTTSKDPSRDQDRKPTPNSLDTFREQQRRAEELDRLKHGHAAD